MATYKDTTPHYAAIIHCLEESLAKPELSRIARGVLGRRLECWQRRQKEAYLEQAMNMHGLGGNGRAAAMRLKASGSPV